MWGKKKRLKGGSRLTRDRKLRTQKLENNFLERIELKSTEQVLKVVDKLKVKLRKTENIVKQHLDYLNFHQIPLNESKENQNLGEIPRFS